MEPAHQTILESLPEKQYRSKLEPHRELIRELRRKGRTYREVAQLFRERLGLYVAPQHLAFICEGSCEASQAHSVRIATPGIDDTRAFSSGSPHCCAQGQTFLGYSQKISICLSRKRTFDPDRQWR